MYKKFLIITLFLISSFGYAAEDASKLVTVKLPKSIATLPEDSKNAAIDVIYTSAKVGAKFIQASRGLMRQDLDTFQQKIEQSTEKISQTIGLEVKKTLNDAITLGVLKSTFLGAIYQGYDLWKNDNPVGLLFIVSGVIGFFWAQKIIDEFENTCNNAAGYLQKKIDIKQFIKLNYYAMKRPSKEPIHQNVVILLEELKDEVALIDLQEKRLRKFDQLVRTHNRKLVGDDNGMTPIISQARKNLNRFNHDVGRRDKPKFVQDDTKELRRVSRHVPRFLEEEKYPINPEQEDPNAAPNELSETTNHLEYYD